MGTQGEPGLYKVVGDGREQSTIGAQQSQSMTQKANAAGIRLFDLTMDPDVQRPPDYFLYIFNTVGREFEFRHPPLAPHVVFPRCPPGFPYLMVAKIPNIIREKFLDENNQARSNPTFGERFCMDLICPDNMGVDVWEALTPQQTAFSGNGSMDMVSRGLFWTRNEIPSPDELAKSKARLEAFYRRKISEANALSRNPKTEGLIGPEHFMAAEYFHLKGVGWYNVAELPSLCPNCGEEIKEGVAYHRNSMDGLCVIDWKRAVHAGAVKMSDVPKDLRWETKEA